MAAKRDYYEVLGIDRTATEADIKKAYRRLAKQYHPDVNKGDSDAEAKFKEISEAYSILSDSEKRANYDRFGHAAFDGNSGFSGFGGFGFGGLDDLLRVLWGLEGTEPPSVPVPSVGMISSMPWKSLLWRLPLAPPRNSI